jgi:hypothetical protein
MSACTSVETVIDIPNPSEHQIAHHRVYFKAFFYKKDMRTVFETLDKANTQALNGLKKDKEILLAKLKDLDEKFLALSTQDNIKEPQKITLDDWVVDLHTNNDGHLTVGVNHHDNPEVFSLDVDIATDKNEWVDRFTTTKLETDNNELL